MHLPKYPSGGLAVYSVKTAYFAIRVRALLLIWAVARTSVAPIDRVKILMQTEKIMVKGNQPRYTSIFQSLRYIVEHEGVSRLWRGNMVNCMRVVPYAATQFASYDKYKQLLGDEIQQLTVVRRLVAGALAGVTGIYFNGEPYRDFFEVQVRG